MQRDAEEGGMSSKDSHFELYVLPDPYAIRAKSAKPNSAPAIRRRKIDVRRKENTVKRLRDCVNAQPASQYDPT